MTRSLTRSQSARTMVRTYGFPSYARMGYVARELDATHYLRAVEWISSHEAASYPRLCSLHIRGISFSIPSIGGLTLSCVWFRVGLAPLGVSSE